MKAYIGRIVCASCRGALAHVYNGKDGRWELECYHSGCEHYRIRYLVPRVELQKAEGVPKVQQPVGSQDEEQNDG